MQYAASVVAGAAPNQAAASHWEDQNFLALGDALSLVGGVAIPYYAEMRAKDGSYWICLKGGQWMHMQHFQFIRSFGASLALGTHFRSDETGQWIHVMPNL